MAELVDLGTHASGVPFSGKLQVVIGTPEACVPRRRAEVHEVVSLIAFVDVGSQAGPLVAQERQSFRVIPIPNRENGYSNFESVAINTKAEFESFLAGTSKQAGWNSRQVFVDALQNANIDFAREALVLLRHNEGSGSVRVTFETPTLVDRRLTCQIRGKSLSGGGTMDMAYYCFAVVVSRSLISEVELRAVEGGFKERELAPIVFPIRAQTANDL